MWTRELSLSRRIWTGSCALTGVFCLSRGSVWTRWMSEQEGYAWTKWQKRKSVPDQDECGTGRFCLNKMAEQEGCAWTRGSVLTIWISKQEGCAWTKWLNGKVVPEQGNLPEQDRSLNRKAISKQDDRLNKRKAVSVQGAWTKFFLHYWHSYFLI